MEDEYQTKKFFEEGGSLKVMFLYNQGVNKLEVFEGEEEEKDELRKLMKLRDIVEKELGRYEKDERRRI